MMTSRRALFIALLGTVWMSPASAQTSGQFSFRVCTGVGAPPVGAVVSNGMWALAGNCPTVPVPVGCVGVSVAPGVDTLGPAVAAQPGGTVFCLGTGTYRVSSPVIPKAGMKIVGSGSGTILSGGKVLAPWVPEGTAFSAAGFLPSSPGPDSGVCTVPGCGILQDVFLDGAPLGRVLSLAAVAPGKFFEDFGANKVYIGDNPTGRVVEQGYAPAILFGTNPGVGVSKLTVQMSANQAQHGAVDCQGSSGWILDSLDVKFNHGVGVECDSFSLTNSRVHHNGQMGVGGHGTGIVLDTVEIDGNNTAGYNYGWEAGGTKFAVSTSNGLVTRSNVHDNNGMGLWCDINCYNWTFSNNTVRNNPAGGIFFEISNKALITGNTLSGNGPASPNGFYLAGDITVSSSPNVEVTGNNSSAVVGIGGLQQNRTDTCLYGTSPSYPDGTAVCPGGSHRLTNLNVHGNIVAPIVGSTTMLAGISVDNGDSGVFSTAGNHFSANTYVLRPSGSFFTWNNQGFLTLSQWQALGLQ